jgi:hypothetical protein
MHIDSNIFPLCVCMCVGALQEGHADMCLPIHLPTLLFIPTQAWVSM